MSTEADFGKDFTITSGMDHAKISADGTFELGMDQVTGSGAETFADYIFGKFDMQIKLNPTFAKSIVTAFYLNSKTEHHNEIDVEFLGDPGRNQYILSTNVFINGTGLREQQFAFWFDPSADFHNYTVIWSPKQIIWFIDGTPIRIFKKQNGTVTLPYPDNQSMKIQLSIWDGTAWTQQPVDWSQAPFKAWYRNYRTKACTLTGNATAISCQPNATALLSKDLSIDAQTKMAEVQSKYMVYNYCNDQMKIFENTPLECAINTKIG
ncbi:Xyloglucan endotransglucosylase/hydrolase [Rhynchospora pubera]|uniref:Xyloglucan endotransglucosylase/hydrolase n=1 Tax=Rhynchospora pubera TaxID=906938 RepID=A0AAV8DPR4_9POAL|nr:Xyloglucan endotransglucosylase/hydrolase [Rhynchospora pubera]